MPCLYDVHNKFCSYFSNHLLYCDSSLSLRAWFLSVGSCMLCYLRSRCSGEKVRILVGKHRGKKARVLRLNKEDYRAELRLSDDDRVVTLDYEDFSKLA